MRQEALVTKKLLMSVTEQGRLAVTVWILAWLSNRPKCGSDSAVQVPKQTACVLHFNTA